MCISLPTALQYWQHIFSREAEMGSAVEMMAIPFTRQKCWWKGTPEQQPCTSTMPGCTSTSLWAEPDGKIFNKLPWFQFSNPTNCEIGLGLQPRSWQAANFFIFRSTQGCKCSFNRQVPLRCPRQLEHWVSHKNKHYISALWAAC